MLSHLAAIFAESPVLQILWGSAVAGSVKGLALFGLAWAALRLCRGLSSELRHRIWLLVIAGSLVSTLAWLMGPKAGLRVPVTIGGRLAWLLGALPFTGRSEFLEILSVPGTQSLATDRMVIFLRRLLPYLLGGVWIAGALFFLQRMLVGRWLAGRLLKRAAPVPMAPGLVTGLCRQLRIRRAVTVLVCRECGIPFTFGTLRPVILLPEEAAGWPARRLRAVLIHELTHVRRMESLLNSVAAAACALLWFVPMLWLSYSLVRQEAEASSDGAVLRHGIPGTDYATDLVELVHGVRGVILPSGAAVPLVRKRFMRQRIMRVLAWRRGILSRPLRMAAIVLTVGFCFLLPLLASTRASLAGDIPLVGTWIDPDAWHTRQAIWSADGRIIRYTLLNSDVPFVVGRYTIEKRWTDEEGSTWYHVKARESLPPYRDRSAWRSLYLIRVSPSGTKLEYSISSWAAEYPKRLTWGEYGVLHRESPR